MAKTNKEFVTGLFQILWDKQPDQQTVDLYAFPPGFWLAHARRGGIQLFDRAGV